MADMQVVIATIGKFHNFDTARQLEKRGALAGIYSGYPRFKLKQTGVSQEKIHCFPYVQTVGMYLSRYNVPLQVKRAIAWTATETFDRHVANNLPPCDVFIGLSSNGLKAARVAKSRNAVYVCDRGSAHIAVQNEILMKEYRAYGLEFPGVDPRVIEKEKAEYELADAIFVPSRFAANSYLEQGISESKLAYAPYGVNLNNFTPVGLPAEEEFNVLYVGSITVRKGIRYLLSAFKNLKHARKRLVLVGGLDPKVRSFVEQEIVGHNVELTGPIPQPTLKEHMSRSHVMVLPSVEDGFGMVLSQAMACGCPVVASDHSGGPDLIEDGVEGYIFSSGDVEQLTDRLQAIADDPALRERMSKASMHRVASGGGWDEYGQTVFQHLNRIKGKLHGT